MKVIIINGYAGVGKTTFVAKCKEIGRVIEISTIDPIKDIAASIGWNGEKTPKDRKFLSDLKDLLTKYNDYPFISTFNEVHRLVSKEDDDNLIIFIHCREPKEIERFKNELGARSLIIRRHEPETITQINHADNDVFEAIYDYTVFNDGSLNDLKERAESFMLRIQTDKWESHL